MRALIQRVSGACVKVDGQTVGEIEKGLLVFLGIFRQDTGEEAALLAKKLLALRIFSDNAGKTNLSLGAVGGQLLVVSQFTLCADCRHGTRPGFSDAAPPLQANALYERFLALCAEGAQVQSGVFGAHMEVSLINDGPFTILLDTDELRKPRGGK